MTRGLVIAGATIAALAFGQPAQANEVFPFAFNGPGVSGSAVVTVAPNVSPPDPNPDCGTSGNNPCRADPPGALKIIAITGTFSDTNNGLAIHDATITGLLPINPANERDTTFDPAVPTSLSFIDYTNETPGNWLTYDNLLFPAGNPIDCNYPFSGTFLDPFGVAFTIAGGDIVDFWGDGDEGPGGSLTFGFAVTNGTDGLDLNFDSLSAAIPEPSTWAMLLIGFAGLGFAAFRRSAKDRGIALAYWSIGPSSASTLRAKSMAANVPSTTCAFFGRINMKKLAFFLLIWLFSTEFSGAVDSHLRCDAACPNNYYLLEPPGSCDKAGQECEIECRNEAQVNEIKGKCIQPH